VNSSSKVALSVVMAIGFCILGSPLVGSAIVLDKKFSNCTALNAVYPGGVAKSALVVNSGGETKQIPTVNRKVYKQNSSKDRDRDGIACER
jgi:hypothetical protein